jgi:hypothetical protein
LLTSSLRMSSVFNIVLELGDSDPAIIKRSEEALKLFARDLEPYSFPPLVHSIREALASSEAGNVSNEDIQTFLLHCFTHVEIVHSKALAHFLWDSTADATPTSESAPTTAIDFILQPIESQQIYVPQHQQFFLDIKLEKGETLVWRYQVGCGQEVDFFALSCDSMFRSIKPRPAVPSEITDKENEGSDDDLPVDEAQPEIPSPSPRDLDRRMSESLDHFIASGSHRLIAKSPQVQNIQIHNISLIASSQSLSEGGWRRQIPFFTSAAPISRSSSTGSYQAQRKSALCRLLWDNSKSSLSGKHVEYCVQKVSDSTMEVFRLFLGSL